MTKLDQDNFSCTWCTWCISAVQISVFSSGDNCGISKGMKITRTAYSRVNKITQLYYAFIQRLLCVSNVGPRIVCVQKEGFRVFWLSRALCPFRKDVIVQICIALLNGMFTPETVWGLVIFVKMKSRDG